MSIFSIASLQLNLSGSDNTELLTSEVIAVKNRFPSVEMVICGELALFGSNFSANHANAETALNQLCELAAKLNIWIIPGSIYRTVDNKHFNSSPVINPEGAIINWHDKIYPFLPYEKDVDCGDAFTLFDVPGIGCFGLCICYDMWFPEVIRNMVCLGAEVIIHPTLTNTVDRDVELCIARANATINQCYIFDINVAGEYGVGRSIICGPGGEKIHEAGSGKEIMTTDIDLDYVKRVREQGWHSLGQTLKSFRDNPIEFSIY
ncbi:MAG: carbon-nitrogen hydrolase family protein, partial [Pseudomonadota bacterium]